MNIFVWKWSKIAAQKKVFFCWICLGPPSYGIGATIRIGWEMLCLPYAGFFPWLTVFYARTVGPYSHMYTISCKASYRFEMIFRGMDSKICNLNELVWTSVDGNISWRFICDDFRSGMMITHTMYFFIKWLEWLKNTLSYIF